MTTDTQLDEKIVVALQPPKLWKVILLNDDHTPMELVIDILTVIFKHSQDSAKQVTLEIHNDGSGVAGVYTHEIAEQKGMEAINIARAAGSPLKVTVEEES
jgi:ATP-dependent Clp protease adaptor protein ClpS